MNDFLLRIRSWYGSLPDPVKAGLAMFFFAFWGTFGLTFTGWMESVVEWARDVTSDSPTGVSFPSLSIVTSALVSAVTAGILAVVNWAGRAFQRAVPAIPGSGPAYPEIPPPAE